MTAPFLTGHAAAKGTNYDLNLTGVNTQDSCTVQPRTNMTILVTINGTEQVLETVGQLIVTMHKNHDSRFDLDALEALEQKINAFFHPQLDWPDTDWDEGDDLDWHSFQ